MKVKRPLFINIGNEKVIKRFDTVELKYDGIWGKVEVNDGKIEIWSRNNKLKKTFDIGKSIPQITFLGEFMYQSAWANIMGNKGDLYIFDLVSFDNEDYRDRPLRERREKLEKILKKYNLPDWMKQVKFYSTKKWKKLWENKVQDKYWEGLIFKKNDSKYGDKWAKKKREFTMDYICTNVNISDSESFEGLAKSLVGSLYVDGVLQEICNVSGLSYKQRKELVENKREYVGKVFEAKGKGLFPSGSLRHPQFLKWRDTKEPKECTKPEWL